MIVLVCGGRDYADKQAVYDVLDKYDPTVVVAGGATGADSLAEDWAKSRQRAIIIFPAEWKKHGKAAGAMRNQRMLRAGPKLVIAFPGGNGTADMVKRARAAGVEVYEHE